jgi:hypothetical protein
MPIASNINNRIAIFETSLDQMFCMWLINPPDKRINIRVKNKNKLVRAGPNGMKNANVRVHTKAAF